MHDGARPKYPLTRRNLLSAGAAGAAALLIGGCQSSPSDGGGADGGIDGLGSDGASPLPDGNSPVDAGLDATPQCFETEDNIEGPFYKAGAPMRSDLREAGMAGERLVISGRVLGRNCAPIAAALVDVWQADWRPDGQWAQYDNAGWRLRGRLNTNGSGAYELRSIIPGHYLNGNTPRPAHIHVKVSAPGFVPLTTQLYFEGDPYNANDPFIEAPLIMKLTELGAGGIKATTFDFVLRALP